MFPRGSGHLLADKHPGRCRVSVVYRNPSIASESPCPKPRTMFHKQRESLMSGPLAYLPIHQTFAPYHRAHRCSFQAEGNLIFPLPRVIWCESAVNLLKVCLLEFLSWRSRASFQCYRSPNQFPWPELKSSQSHLGAEILLPKQFLSNSGPPGVASPSPV